LRDRTDTEPAAGAPVNTSHAVAAKLHWSLRSSAIAPANSSGAM
jgi:hypothetical protein